MQEFTKLFEPGRIGKMEVRNRIVLPPMATIMAEEGFVSDRQIDYYEARASGGAGMITVESSYTQPGGYFGRLRLDEDKFLPGLKKLAAAIHNGGAKACIQINIGRGRSTDHDPVSASAVKFVLTGMTPRAITVPEIKKLEESFAEGVSRVKEAGFDAILIHGAGGYLLADFLSPRTNKRTDEYGGNVRKRAQLALELIEIARARVGPDYPILIRIRGDEKLEGGFGVADAIAYCKLFQEKGINGIDIVVGITPESHEWFIPSAYMPAGCNAEVSGAIKKALKIPVCVAGKINDPHVAEKILREGKSDFVSVGRGLISDPEFSKKAMEGRPEDIRKCIACLTCHELVFFQRKTVKCAINPEVGREREFRQKMKPAGRVKKVLVIGGGPAGMQAAATAAERGHTVTLWEAGDKLGGQLNLALVPSGKDDISSLLAYLKTRLVKSSVKLELGKQASVAAVEKFAPDAVIVAAGSVPFIPPITGVAGKNVIGYREVLSGEKEAGKTVVVIGGGFVGSETAYFLGEKGKRVTLAFVEPEIIVLHPDNKKLVLDKLNKCGVKIIASVKKFLEVTPEGVKLVDANGKEVFLKADSVVLATGSVPDKSLAKSLKGKVSELYEVGDCVEARRIMNAIHEAAEVAINI